MSKIQLVRHMLTAIDEFDFLERLKPSAVLQYFQDAATEHATVLGIGYENMRQQNLCWVLSRVSAVIHKDPKVEQSVSVTTYMRKPGMAETVRDYEIRSADGELLVSGTSKWCVIDFTTRAIRRCAPLFSFPDDSYRTDYVFEGGNVTLPALTDRHAESDFIVQNCDLDRNMHMNNARYGDVIFNACPIEFLRTHSVQSFDLNFLSELKAGDSIRVFAENCGSSTCFEAVCGEKIAFRAKIGWRKND